MKLLALLLPVAVTLTLNSALASENLTHFKLAKKSLITGVFYGETSSYDKKCKASLKIQKNIKGEEEIVGKIEFLDYDNKPATSTIHFNPNEEGELNFDPDKYGEEDQRTASLTKSKEMPEPDNEEMTISIFESLVQEIDGNKLLSVTFESAIVNEHSDPSESRLECRINQ